MKIKKYKYLGNNKYKVYIEDREYIIYEDIIIKYNFLAKDDITEKELNKFLEENSFFEYYYLSIKYINTKLRTSKEIYKYLQKHEVKKEIINLIIEKLEKDNYLNEKVYAKAYINDAINLKTEGPLKIKKDLEDLGISKDVIDEEINIYTDEIINKKINKYIDKESKMNHNKSFKMLKIKIINNLINKGFPKESIVNRLENLKIDDKDIYEREYKKVKEKLSKKYIGKELEFKIKSKMYEKGFSKDDYE